MQRFLENGQIFTIQNDAKSGGFCSFWNYDFENFAEETKKIHATKTIKLHEYQISSFCMNSKTLIIGTADGLIKKLSLSNLSEIEIYQETELRISHIIFLGNKFDHILAVFSDSGYTILPLDEKIITNSSFITNSDNILLTSGKSFIKQELGQENNRPIWKKRLFWLIIIIAGIIIIGLFLLYFIYIK